MQNLWQKPSASLASNTIRQVDLTKDRVAGAGVTVQGLLNLFLELHLSSGYLIDELFADSSINREE